MPTLIRYRAPILGAFMAVLIAGLPLAKRAIVPDHGLELWFVDGDSALARYRSFQAQFGNDEIVVLGYRHEKLLQTSQLERIRELTERLESISGIETVLSIANSRDVVREGFFVRQITPAFEYRSEARLRSVLTGSDVSAGRLINDDGTMTMLWIAMEAGPDFDVNRGRILGDIRATAGEVLGAESFHLGGTGVIYDALNRATERDFRKFVLLTYVTIFFLVYALFGRTLSVLYILLVVVSAVTGTIEIMGLTGRRLNMVTVMLPTVITILGIADAVHVLNRFSIASSGPACTRAARVLNGVFRPALYTSITTAAGFLSFGFTDMPIMSEFGLYAAVGVLIAFVATFVIGAALLPFGNARHRRPLSQQTVVLRSVAGTAWQRPWLTGVAFLILAGLAALGIRRLEVDTYTLGYLPGDNLVVRDHRFLEAHWGHYATLDLIVTPKRGLDMRDATVVAALRRFGEEVVTHPHVSAVFDIHTIIDRYAAVRGGSRRSAANERDVREAVTLMESQSPKQMRRLISEDYRVGRVTLTGAMLSAGDLKHSLSDVQDMARHHLGSVASIEIAGYPALYVRIIDYIWQAQVASFWLAIAMILSAMLILLRDRRLALLAMVPNLFPIVIMLGAMGYLGLDLDAGTATIAAILLGVGIDDTIHILVHFQRASLSLAPQAAILETMSTIGRSVVATTVILAVGFSVLVLAEVRTAVYFGLLTGIGVVAALIGDLVLLPALLRMTSSDAIDLVAETERSAESTVLGG